MAHNPIGQQLLQAGRHRHVHRPLNPKPMVPSPRCKRLFCQMATSFLASFGLLWISCPRTTWAYVSVASSRFAVTELQLIGSRTDQDALKRCEGKDGWIPAGVSWTGYSGPSARLCVHRVFIDTLDGATPVIARIVVLEDAKECPKAMNLLTEIRLLTDGVALVCTQSSPASEALHKRNFVSDVTVTRERNYNNEFSGWTTLPVNVLTRIPNAPKALRTRLSTTSAYLSFQRQVLPIVDFKTIDSVAPQHAFQACESLPAEDSAFWEQAGDGFIDMSDCTARKVLCIKRDVNAAGKQDILTDVSLTTVPGGSSCDSGFSHATILGASATLCGRFVNSSARNDQVFVGDLALFRASSKYSESLLPGSFRGFETDLNGNALQVSTYLFYRNVGEFTLTPPGPNSKPPLVARQTADGGSQFKILQFADMHFTGDPNYLCRDPPRGMRGSECRESVMTTYMNSVLDLENPDFVVFTGDNVETLSSDKQQAAMDAATDPVEQRGIPWAMVFGNHDNDNGFRRDQVYEAAAAKNYTYIQRGPAEVDGFGNYELSVVGSDASKTLLRIYFLDSHSYPDESIHPDTGSGYDWVKQNQIDYYRVMSDAHRNDRVPSLMFFHIPIPEYEASSNKALSGEKYEAISSPMVNTNLFSTLVDHQEVKAVFVGHDHMNDYCYKRQGIQLCYGGGVGFGRAYALPTFSRRVRVIEWNQNIDGSRTIKSWKRLFSHINQISNLETLYQE